MNHRDLAHGIYPMLYAFFDRHGNLDAQAMRRQVQACVTNGAHGLAVLGLGTEIDKLSETERRQIVDWVAEELAGRLPLAITINAPTVEAQVEFARFAHSRGASWLILQPPPDRGVPEDFYIRFFGAVADRVELPVAVQNAPEYLGVGLTPAGVRTLAQGHPNFRLLKAEGSALSVRAVIEEAGDNITVFNGRGGLELIDNLRAGCAGVIPATDCFDRQVRIFDLLRSGAEDEAEAIYREVLPAIVFVMQSLHSLHTYGKRIAALRLGLGDVFDRAPALRPGDFGLRCVQRYAAALGPLE